MTGGCHGQVHKFTAGCPEVGSVRDPGHTRRYSRPPFGGTRDVFPSDGVDPHLWERRRSPRRRLYDHRAGQCPCRLGRLEEQEPDDHLHYTWPWRPLVWSWHCSRPVSKCQRRGDAAPFDSPASSRTNRQIPAWQATSYSVRNAVVGSMLSARRVGTTQPSMQTPSMTIP